MLRRFYARCCWVFYWKWMTPRSNAEVQRLPDKLNVEHLPVEIGGVGSYGIECTCLKKDFPCPFHFNDNK